MQFCKDQNSISSINKTFRIKLQVLLIILVASVFYSCHRNEKHQFTINGIWNSVGYGQQLSVNDSVVSVYDRYQGGCALNIQLPKTVFESYLTTTRLTSDSLTLRLGFTNYHYVRLSEGEENCSAYSKSNDPFVNFDALWYTFQENYPSFVLKGINWENMREEYRARLTEQTTDFELYTILNQMISELNDGHVSIEVPEALEYQIEEKEDQEADSLRIAVINTINTRYVENLKTYNRGSINWGTINDNTGYIQINDFENLANFSLAPELTTEEFWEEYWEKAEESENYFDEVLNGFNEVMPQIFNDIKGTGSCIIDVRFNGGGFDQIGLEVLSYFTSVKKVAFHKKARYLDGFTQKQTIYIQPKTNTYSGKLYILTSHQTASASETFVLASQSLPSATRIGSNTEGILSDVLSKRLPNGWEYGLSNEIYESANGINYEDKGIPADYKLVYPKNAVQFYRALLTKTTTKDPAIEKALKL